MNEPTHEECSQRGRLWRVELDSLPTRVAQAADMHLRRWKVSLPLGEFAELALTLRDILTYARTGLATTWSDPASARAALRAMSILHDAVITDRTEPMDWIDSTDTDGLRGELLEVCRAALARVRIAELQPVPRHWLAALAGVSGKLIAKNVGSKSLRSVKGRMRDRGLVAKDIDPVSARRWLESRGVQGMASGTT